MQSRLTALQASVITATMTRLTVRRLALCILAAAFGCSGTGDPGSDGLDVTDEVTVEDTLPQVAGSPGTFKLFDRIPQFGMYATTEPNYKPPPGVLSWSLGTFFATKLSPAQKAQIGTDLKARITYHAQCDNYDRIGGLYFVVVPQGTTPTVNDPRTELARIITPFSSYTRGALATFVFPLADISTYARTLADPSHDVWVVIGGGSNPYGGDPCARANRPADYRAIGYLYSLEFVSTKPLTPGPSVSLTGLASFSAKATPITTTITAPEGGLTGRINVIVSGHGAERGGNEYMNTVDTLSVNGKAIGSFSTKVDCAALERFSPEGNPGIFRNNNGSNPRNWCPGSLVAPRSFPVTLVGGKNTVTLAVNPGRVPAGSYYATSISFTSP